MHPFSIALIQIRGTVQLEPSPADLEVGYSQGFFFFFKSYSFQCMYKRSMILNWQSVWNKEQNYHILSFFLSPGARNSRAWKIAFKDGTKPLNKKPTFRARTHLVVFFPPQKKNNSLKILIVLRYNFVPAYNFKTHKTWGLFTLWCKTV